MGADTSSGVQAVDVPPLKPIAIPARLADTPVGEPKYSVSVKNSNGEELILVQIAGLIARRIVCTTKKDEEIKQGGRFGIIRFGSRVDLYFTNYNLLVCKNQKTISGETLIARKV